MLLRFSLGSLLAAVAVVSVYLATALHAHDPRMVTLSSIVSPILLLLAVIAWIEPGRISRWLAAAWRFLVGRQKRTEEQPPGDAAEE